jgi:hypothetical protein
MLAPDEDAALEDRIVQYGHYLQLDGVAGLVRDRDRLSQALFEYPDDRGVVAYGGHDAFCFSFVQELPGGFPGALVGAVREWDLRTGHERFVGGQDARGRLRVEVGAGPAGAPVAEELDDRDIGERGDVSAFPLGAVGDVEEDGHLA